MNFSMGCISFVSYIKPQPALADTPEECVVYLLYPTSNHNWRGYGTRPFEVVYLLYPTSNHNL